MLVSGRHQNVCGQICIPGTEIERPERMPVATLLSLMKTGAVLFAWDNRAPDGGPDWARDAVEETGGDAELVEELAKAEERIAALEAGADPVLVADLEAAKAQIAELEKAVAKKKAATKKKAAG